MKNIKQHELAFDSRDDAIKVADILLNNGYVVMLSVEEKLTILNYEIGEYITHLGKVVADRNAVVFMNTTEFESWFYENDNGDEHD